MKTIRHATAFLAFFSFALAAWAIPSTSAPDGAAPAPAIVARLEVRGIAQLADTIERAAGPTTLPTGQLRALATMMLGVDPVALFGDTDSPIRGILYAFPGAAEPGILFDVPAANNDPDAFFAKLAAVATPQEIPEAQASKLPEGTRFFRVSRASGDNRVLALPHGSRVAILPFAQRGGLRPAQVPSVLAAAEPLASEGVIAVAADLDALAPLLPEDGAGDFPGIGVGLAPKPVRELEIGLGLDGADRLRLALASILCEGTPEARAASGTGAAAPIANAILFPEALFASAQRSGTSSITEAEHLASMRETFAANPVYLAAEPAQKALFDRFAALFAKWTAALGRLSPADNSFVLLPANEAKHCPWAFYAANPDASAILDKLPGAVESAAADFFDFAKAAAEAANDGDFDAEAIAKVEGARLRLEPAGERKILDRDVRTFALRLTDPDTGRDWTLCTFDALAADGALLFANLAEPVLAGVIADLAAGETARAPVAEMPAFAKAYGATPPAGAAVAFVQLVPAVRTVFNAIKARVDELDAEEKALDAAEGKEPDADGEDDDEIFPAWVSAMLDAADLPDCPIAVTERYDGETRRLEGSLVVPLADLRALHERLAPLFADGGEDTPSATADDDGDEDSGEDAFTDW
jgi:hypothetical protein